MKRSWGIASVVATIALGAPGLSPRACGDEEQFCRSQEFRATFLEGQQGVVIDEAQPSPRLVGFGNAALDCLVAISERGGSVYSIEGCLPETRECRTWALGTIRRIGTPEARSYLVQYLASASDKGLRLAAMESLGALREKAARPGLMELLENADPDLRAESIVSLGAIGERSDYPAMRKVALSLPDKAFYRALHGFRLLGDDRALEDLRPRIQAIKDETTRLAAARSWESWRAALTEEARVLTVLHSAKEAELYRAIQESRSHSPETREALFAILDGDDPRGRAEAVMALGKMHITEDFERLLAVTVALPEPFIPLAAKGLELLNDERALEPLEKLAGTMTDGSRRSQVQGVIERLRRSVPAQSANPAAPLARQSVSVGQPTE